ncbi:nucleoside triphosphate pyrophosphatase [Chitinimonas sp. BJYL2]|uniref:Maf family protein n=1 Tax=Chitinimonas sp. BJYL2 TaxID=2976696 RepID=UPI0022B39127|nr:Maf family protein [Chitinimonas sp. BJYL2]
MSKPVLYLASASPRRRELLAQIGVPIERIVCEIDETPLINEAPRAYVERLARGKAAAGMAVVQRDARPAGLLLAADTTVALGNTLLGKPADTADACAMLRSLSGQTHHVLTAVAVTDGHRIGVRTSMTEVRFRTLDEATIAAYVATGEPMDKAGSYGAQGRGALLIDTLSGSFSGVVGLPLAETGDLLREFAYPLWA